VGKEERAMIKALSVGVLGMMLCIFAPSPAASQEQPLSGEEVKKLFDGNTELGEGRKDDVDTGRRWKAFYAADGSVRKREANGNITKGIWFIDEEGRNCFRWEHKDEPKCDAIVRQEDHYLRVREGQVRGLIRIEKGNPGNL
jgi:hypothetical protein